MKIAFLAMSGVRAHDPKLLELGLTLPGFVSRSKVIASLPSLGLLYLAAVTPPGHELKYFESEESKELPEEIYTYDLVAISTFSAQVKEAYAIADKLRARGVRVAMGGLHVSVLPEEASRHANYIVVGEGENVWPEVVKHTDAGGADRVFDAKDYDPVDVSKLPVPRYDLLDDREYNRYTVQTTRGCPWRCEFCASNVMLGKPYRKRPVEHVVRDIQAILDRDPTGNIEFADDNTFVDKRWAKELCRALIPLKIKWFTETDLSVADDEELLVLLKESGCRQLLIGLESPGGEALHGLEQNTDIKYRWAKSYVEKLRKIHAHGLTVNGCFVLGLDEHTPRIFEEIYDFAHRVPLYEVQVTLQTPFPGTPLYTRLKNEDRLLEQEAWEKCTLFDLNFQPKNMSCEELKEGIYWLSEKLYSQNEQKKRRRNFFEWRKEHAREELEIEEVAG